MEKSKSKKSFSYARVLGIEITMSRERALSKGDHQGCMKIETKK
jgi:hypothetical protein